jgi:hypothetical protein
MTTKEIIDAVASWKLGGNYEDESPANTQLRILNLINTGRQKVLRDYYAATRTIPDICYQEFDVIADWTNESGCATFVATIPEIISLPHPKVNGWDALLPQCENAMPLTQVQSENQLRSARNNSIAKRVRTSGWFLVTNNRLTGYLKPLVKAEGLTARAVVAHPQLVEGFNTEKDIYPFPEDMLSELQAQLIQLYSRNWMNEANKVSNSKSEIGNVRGK